MRLFYSLQQKLENCQMTRLLSVPFCRAVPFRGCVLTLNSVLLTELAGLGKYLALIITNFEMI